MKSSSSLALRMDVPGDADETPETAAAPAGMRDGVVTPRRTGFDYRALEQSAFDRRVIVIREQRLPLFRVY